MRDDATEGVNMTYCPFITKCLHKGGGGEAFGGVKPAYCPFTTNCWPEEDEEEE